MRRHSVPSSSSSAGAGGGRNEDRGGTGLNRRGSYPLTSRQTYEHHNSMTQPLPPATTSRASLAPQQLGSGRRHFVQPSTSELLTGGSSPSLSSHHHVYRRPSDDSALQVSSRPPARHSFDRSFFGSEPAAVLPPPIRAWFIPFSMPHGLQSLWPDEDSPCWLLPDLLLAHHQPAPDPFDSMSNLTRSLDRWHPFGPISWSTVVPPPQPRVVVVSHRDREDTGPQAPLRPQERRATAREAPPRPHHRRIDDDPEFTAAIRASLSERGGGLYDPFTSDFYSAPKPHLTPAQAAKLPSRKPRATERDQACAVCQEDIDANANVSSLPCKHAYHSSCIRESLAHDNRCPVCRTRVPTQ